MQQQVDHYARKLEFEIDSWDLYAAQKAGEDVVVLDARSVEAYEKGYIPGAISFPHKLMTPENTADFRREALYAVYCDGIGCNASTAGALKMARMGFKVKELIGGLNWWKDNGYPIGTADNPAAIGAETCGCE